MGNPHAKTVVPPPVSPPPPPHSYHEPDPYDSTERDPQKEKHWPAWDGGITLKIAVFQYALQKGFPIAQIPHRDTSKHIFRCLVAPECPFIVYAAADEEETRIKVLQFKDGHNHTLALGLSYEAESKLKVEIGNLHGIADKITEEERARWRRFRKATEQVEEGVTRSGKKRARDESSEQAIQRNSSSAHSRTVYTPSPQLGAGTVLRSPIEPFSVEVVRPKKKSVNRHAQSPDATPIKQGGDIPSESEISPLTPSHRFLESTEETEPTPTASTSASTSTSTSPSSQTLSEGLKQKRELELQLKKLDAEHDLLALKVAIRNREMDNEELKKALGKRSK